MENIDYVSCVPKGMFIEFHMSEILIKVISHDSRRVRVPGFGAYPAKKYRLSLHPAEIA